PSGFLFLSYHERTRDLEVATVYNLLAFESIAWLRSFPHPSRAGRYTCRGLSLWRTNRLYFPSKTNAFGVTFGRKIKRNHTGKRKSCPFVSPFRRRYKERTPQTLLDGQ